MHVRTDPFFETFSALPDPRKDINKKHLMFDMLFITLCAVISGVKSWEQIEEFAIDREDWLRKYIELPHGIPSHDAIRYLFLFLDAKAFNKAFAEWVEKIRPTLDENHIAIDGKTSRRSGSKSSSLKPLHSVSAWATDVSLVLGQVHVNEKSNEITAIPELLEMLELNGCLVSIDAMGCQKDIAAKIIDKEGDYVLALKANQKNLHEEVKDFFDDAIENNFRDTKIYKFQETEKDHGRLETRQYYVTSDIADLFEVKNWSESKALQWCWQQERSMGKPVRKSDTTSAAFLKDTGESNVALEGIGALKIHCIGFWMCALTKINAGNESKIQRQIFLLSEKLL